MTAGRVILSPWVLTSMWASGPPLLVITTPPPDAAADSWPLDGNAARRLLGIAHLGVPSWLRAHTPGDAVAAYFETVALWPEYTATRPAWEARARANALTLTGRTVILLGREAERAFAERLDNGGSKVPFCTWVNPAQGDDAAVYLLLPHPSPLNRVFNQKHHRQVAGSAIKRALEAA